MDCISCLVILNIAVVLATFLPLLYGPSVPACSRPYFSARIEFQGIRIVVGVDEEVTPSGHVIADAPRWRWFTAFSA
jgi:hypothetical protein